MNLLIIEDNKQMYRAMKSFVLDLAEGIYECRSGSEALAAYARHRPDWVLVDLEMAQAGGLRWVLEIKRAYPEARILIVSNYDDADLRAAALDAGACEYVVKHDLLSVRRILSAPPIQS
jgi:DNA-binding NarL/FixJ family response regulator